jgi:VIT1/CCC1 family predicted Fe2+/Mn2+ transporter
VLAVRRALLEVTAFIVFISSMTESKQEKIEDAILASQEFRRAEMSAKLNWLRAGVLGANDGIMSTSGLLMGVAGGTSNAATIMLAGIAAVVAGSISMAGGEYTSVSAQRDSELASLEIERKELAANPEAELRELTWYYEQKGLSFELAEKVAIELTSSDALKAHAEAELGIEVGQHASPVQAAVPSFVAFAAGGALPLLAAIATPENFRIPALLLAVLVALILTGYLGAKIGGSKTVRSIIRNVSVSLLTMGITYLIGMLVGRTLV